MVLLFPLVWFAAILAQSMPPELALDTFLAALTDSLSTPLSLRWTERTAPVILGAVLCYGMAIAIYYSGKTNGRPGEEYGSAKWGNSAQVNAKYRHPKPESNILFSQNVRMGLDPKRHRRNLHTLVIGGSGAGKTRFFCKPQLMQTCPNSKGADQPSSFFVCDPKGEMLRSVGPLLAETHDIKCIDLINMELSDYYNPFEYIRDDKDVLKLVTNLIKSTTPKNSSSNDPFWEKSETALLSALMLYLIHTAPKNEQNFSTLMYMIENAAASENEDQRSPVDILFEALEEDDPQHIAVKQYKVFKQAPGKTAMSILVSAAVRLSAFNLPQLQRITNKDTLDLGTLGEKPRAIFAVIPDNDSTFNFIVSMLYTQLFQQLYHVADYKYGGALPYHVRVLQDEWANVALPDDYPKVLATARSRNIGLYAVVQGISQIKALFKDDWEGIVGNFDTILYLGGNEQFSHKWISEALGKASIATKTRGITRGKSGSSSENHNQVARSLLDPNEVRTLDNRYAIVLIRGEPPVLDLKYDIMKHPNVKRTEDGGAAPYLRAPSYEQDDLSAPFTSLDDIEFID